MLHGRKIENQDHQLSYSCVLMAVGTKGVECVMLPVSITHCYYADEQVPVCHQ